MNPAHKDYIVDLFVWLDDNLPKNPKTPGRKPALKDSEMLTILLWSALTEHHRRLKDIYNWIGRYYPGYFPLPAYQNFCLASRRLIPTMAGLLDGLLASESPVVFADSTMVPVCKNVRADRHRVAKDIAAWGKNHQGWHFGFKLHAATDHLNRLCSLNLTPASAHDNQSLRQLVNQDTDILVGDSAYGGSVPRRYLWADYQTIVIAPPHHTQKGKLLADWQLKLLRLRPKVEAVFGLLKEHFSLVTHYPRTPAGYLAHYLRVLLGYQLATIS